MSPKTSTAFIDQLYKTLFSPPPTHDGIQIGREHGSRAPIVIPASSLSLGLVVIGGSGRGKSNSLRALVWELIKRKARYGDGFSVVDPHGTLATWTLDAIARAVPHLVNDVSYLDLG